MEESLTILNVDDNEAGRYSISRILKQAGFHVLEAAAGADALERAQEVPDLILLDVNLPDINGVEVCRRLKADPATRSIPVLHLSATAVDSMDKVYGLEGGADGYLTQPVGEDLLLAHINSLLRSSRLERRLARANRSLKAVLYCGEAMLRAQSEFDLMQEGCRILVEVAGYGFVWVGIREPDAERTIRPMARWGDDKGLSQIGQASWDEDSPGCCPMGVAVRTGSPCLISDIRTDSRCEPWRAEALKRGFASAIALPLYMGNEVWGAISILSPKRESFDNDEITLLSELANDLSYGIESLRNREQALKSQEALQASEELLRLSFENANIGVCLVDSQGRLLKVNNQMCEMFGYSKAELESMTVNDIAHPDDLDLSPRFIERARSGQTDRGEFEKRYIHKQGHVVWGKVVSSLVRDREGNPLYFISHVQNITDHKLMEQEAERLQTQLLQAQKMEAVGTLAGGIAHDFNNILQVILGYSEFLLANKEQTDDDYGALQKVSQAGKRGADLVQHLLMFSKKIQPQLHSVNLNDEVVQIQKLLSRTIPKIIKIQLGLSGDLEKVQADPSQIGQVVMNLAVNARDAMPDGGTLTIETTNVDLDADYCSANVEVKPGRYGLITVSDTGHGMDKETLSHVFEPFFTTKEVGKGTGLGLATVYGIIKQHQGHITCHSELGVGTTFKIYLPVDKTEKQAEGAAPETIPRGGTEETILLVDDEEFLRDFGTSILTHFGYTVLTACDGREALEIYQRRRNTISLVLLDLIMPEMDGKRCLKEILRIDPQAKVLIASGYSVDGPVHEAGLVGAKNFVEKPFAIGQLLQLVRDVIDGD